MVPRLAGGVLVAVLEIVVEGKDRPDEGEMAPALKDGGHLRGFEQRVRCKDRGYRWISWSTTPVPEENLLFGVGRDVTDRREFDRQRDLFIADLNHRVKNTLAVVQAMASQTFRAEAGDPSGVIRKYQKRIAALALAQDLLTDRNWGPVLLGDLVDRRVGREHRLSRRIVAEGPTMRLPPRQAIATALALNELLENAASHGALSGSSGTVTIRWQRDSEDRFELNWPEPGETVQEAPGRAGFGTHFLKSLGDEFEGESCLRHEADGLKFRLSGRLQN